MYFENDDESDLEAINELYYNWYAFTNISDDDDVYRWWYLHINK